MAPGSMATAVSAVVFAATLAFYRATQYPSVSGGDSGELLAEACLLGVAHPPGYPLFTVLYHGAMRAPAWTGAGATPAARANLLSSAFGAGAAALLYLAVELWARDVLPGAAASPRAAAAQRVARHAAGVAAAAAYATSPLVHTYTAGAEVFSMNNCFAALLCYLTLRAARARNRGDGAATLRCARWGAFCVGLGLCNQHTLVLYAAPLCLWVLAACGTPGAAPKDAARRPAATPRHRVARRVASRAFSAAELASLALCGALGLAPYAYLPWAQRGGRATPGSWGHTGTARGLWRHVSREEYGSLRLSPVSDGASSALSGMLARLRAYARDLAHEVGGFCAAPDYGDFGGGGGDGAAPCDPNAWSYALAVSESSLSSCLRCGQNANLSITVRQNRRPNETQNTFSSRVRV